MRMDADKNNDLISLFQFERILRGGAKDLADFYTFIEDDIEQFGNAYAWDTNKMYL